MSAVETIPNNIPLSKFKMWKNLTQNKCPALTMNFCFWSGLPCSFNHCPRRVYEESIIGETQEQADPKYKVLAENMESLCKQIEELRKIVEEKLKTSAPQGG